MLSNSQRGRALHRVYTLIRHLDPSAEIKRDDLHSVYAVNKYGIRVRFDQARFGRIKDDFILKYCQEYGLIQDQHGYYCSPESGLVLTVNEQDMRYFNQNWTAVDITLF